MRDRAIVPYNFGQDSDGVRTVALPSYIPEGRKALIVRAARYSDPTIFHWLTHLPIYTDTYIVVLSTKGVIHLGAPGDFRCGTRPAGTLTDGKGIAMLLREALAKIVDEQGMTTEPKPCQICFDLGLLVRTSPGQTTDNEEETP